MTLPDPADRYVVFDLDGVLLDSEQDLSWLDRALSATLEELDVPDTDANRDRLWPADVAKIERTAARFGVPTDRLWEVRNRHYTETKMAAIESGELEPFDDIDQLYDLEGPFGIISNSPETVVERFVEVYDLGELFTTLIGRGANLQDLNQLKPDPHFYRQLITAAEQGDVEYVYVGNADSDRTFANRTGMAYIHVDRTDPSDEAAGDLGDVVDRLDRDQ
ncbi:MAG: HAD family hydrolase [Halobacteriales archaeon]